jgi:hypothetical protein
LGVGRKALQRHRDHHVPALLDRVLAAPDLEAPSPLVDDLARHYGRTLDALAAAQSGVLAHLAPAGSPGAAPSFAAVSASIDDARHHVDAIAGLFLDALHAGQLAMPLNPRVRAGLRQIMERSMQLAETTPAPTTDA